VIEAGEMVKKSSTNMRRNYQIGEDIKEKVRST
jgi:hypothetical protein